MKVGFSTMTADLIHAGHINFLRYCKLLCDTLVIGLTTDELAIRQKRQPFMSYEHRKCILENLEQVDIVVAHQGQTKIQMYQQIKFDILFIGDDYKNDEDYKSFNHTFPNISVIYIPRTPSINTTSIIDQISYRIISNFSIESQSTGGSIIRNTNWILKPVNIGRLEYTELHGKDVYNIGYPYLLRNWVFVDKEEHVHPGLSGVNSYREIICHQFIHNYSWNPVIEIKMGYFDETTCDKSGYAIYERSKPCSIYWIIQKYCGITMVDFLNSIEPLDRPKKISDICTKMKIILQDLRDLGLVHGDVHPGNICIDNNEQLYLIDFGWCMHECFDFSPNEKEYYNQCLLYNFDWVHFTQSLASIYNYYIV